MAAFFYLLVGACAAVTAAAPPAPRVYSQHQPAQLQQINPLDYYLDNPDVSNYYNQAPQKQENVNSGSEGAPSRLETLEPDSEVELIPGAQQPQQPPQQTPVSPNLPGIVPGQRVFIVHMPVPGYRPGTIGGYQPVYIVAAAPQGNPGFPATGYQNAFFLDPSGQAVVSPLIGYPRSGVPGVSAQGGNPGLLFGAAPLTLNRPFNLVYQEPIAYQPNQAPQPTDGGRGSLRLSQLVALQGQPAHPAANPGTGTKEATSTSESKREDQTSNSDESKEAPEPRRNARPTPPHAQTRNKA